MIFSTRISIVPIVDEKLTIEIGTQTDGEDSKARKLFLKKKLWRERKRRRKQQNLRILGKSLKKAQFLGCQGRPFLLNSGVRVQGPGQGQDTGGHHHLQPEEQPQGITPVLDASLPNLTP